MYHAVGLHVKVGLIGTEQIFEYAPGPFRQEMRDIDWVSMTACETTYPHIRLHDLKKEDSLTFFMSTMASTPATKAIIFINSENNLRSEFTFFYNSTFLSCTFTKIVFLGMSYGMMAYTLCRSYTCIIQHISDFFSHSVPFSRGSRLLEKFQSEEQSPPVPVLVVAKETGMELLRLVGEHPRDVHVKVDKLSCQDVLERGGLLVCVCVCVCVVSSVWFMGYVQSVCRGGTVYIGQAVALSNLKP